MDVLTTTHLRRMAHASSWGSFGLSPPRLGLLARANLLDSKAFPQSTVAHQSLGSCLAMQCRLCWPSSHCNYPLCHPPTAQAEYLNSASCAIRSVAQDLQTRYARQDVHGGSANNYPARPPFTPAAPPGPPPDGLQEGEPCHCQVRPAKLRCYGCRKPA